MDKSAAVGLMILIIVVYVFCLWLFRVIWNAVIPDVCGFTTITMWQAFLISTLGGLVVGGGSRST